MYTLFISPDLVCNIFCIVPVFVENKDNCPNESPTINLDLLI